MQYLKIYFLFPSAVFRCLSNDITLKGLFLHHCVVFSLFCVAIVISEPFFARAYYFGGARSKGFTTLRNVSKLQFFDKIVQAKFVGFRLYSAI